MDACLCFSVPADWFPSSIETTPVDYLQLHAFLSKTLLCIRHKQGCKMVEGFIRKVKLCMQEDSRTSYCTKERKGKCPFLCFGVVSLPCAQWCKSCSCDNGDSGTGQGETKAYQDLCKPLKATFHYFQINHHSSVVGFTKIKCFMRYILAG
jgi:hypothetical protein